MEFDTARPGHAARVTSLVRQISGGKDFDSRFGVWMTGQGPLADLLAKRFDLARKRFALERRINEFNLNLFRRPPRAGDQLSLF